MKLLLTGFEPFGGDVLNPSWEIARALDGTTVGSARVVACQLPCVFGRAPQVLRQALAQGPFALVVALGMAGSRTGLSFERIAVNLDDAPIPDNAGQQPVDMAVLPQGPAAYFSTLPVKRMVDAVRAAGIAADTSQTAGTFVCNHVLYGLMHLLAQGAAPQGARGGFVHVPWLSGQGEPHLPLRDMVRGIHAALWAAVLAPQDIALQAGATH